MTDQVNSLEELGQVAEGAEAPVIEAETPREPVRDELGRSYATGKRKDAVARVWIKPGSGKVEVNGKEMGKYLGDHRATSTTVEVTRLATDDRLVVELAAVAVVAD